MKPLGDFLADDWGLFVDAGWEFYSAAAISDDGRTIVGTGFDPTLGATVAFIATVPEPATALLLASGLAALAARRRAPR